MAVTHLEVGKTYRFDANNASDEFTFLHDADTIITVLSSDGEIEGASLPFANVDFVSYEGGQLYLDDMDDTHNISIRNDFSFIFTPTQVGNDGADGFPYITEVQIQNPVLDKIIKVTPAQYNTLKNGGTVGPYTGLDPNNLYLVKDNTVYPDDSQVVHKTGDETIAGEKTFTTGITISGDGLSSKIYYNDGGWLCVEENNNGVGYLSLGNLKFDGEISQITFGDGEEPAALGYHYDMHVLYSDHGFGGIGDWYFAIDHTLGEAIYIDKDSGILDFLVDINDRAISKVDLDNHRMIYPWGIKIGDPDNPVFDGNSMIEFYPDSDGVSSLIISWNPQGHGQIGVSDISDAKYIQLRNSGIDIIAGGSSETGNIIFANKTAGTTANVRHYYTLPTNGSNNYDSPTSLATELDLPKIKRFI